MHRPSDPTDRPSSPETAANAPATASTTGTLLERAIAEIRAEPGDEAALAAAAGRVWNRLRAETATAASPALFAATPGADAHHGDAVMNTMDSKPDTDAAAANPTIEGCAGFQALFPALLQGALTESRRLLVEDHARECVACRRALAELRRGRPAGASTAVAAASVSGGRTAARRWALAAGLAGLVLVTAAIATRFAGAPVSADVESIAGALWRIDDPATADPSRVGSAIAAGTRLEAGDIVRTAAGSGAVLRLADGSRLELAERSELRLERRRGRVGLDLVQGGLIVDASHRGGGAPRPLVVGTGDFEAVADAGIFAVRRGTKGARLSVLSGEARLRDVERRGDARVAPAVLRSGEQYSSRVELARVSLNREVAWSRDAARYRREIEAMRTVGRAIDEAFAAPARRSTRLLDLVPASTSVYVAAPNVSNSIADAWAALEDRIADNPALRGWFGQNVDPQAIEDLEAMIAELRDFGGDLGEELVIAADPSRTRGGVVALAEVPRPAAFGPVLDQAIARWNERAAQENGPRLRRVEGPAAAGDQEVLVWLDGDLLIASPDGALLAEVDAASRGGSGSPGFAATSFRARLADVYESGEGAGWVGGVALAQMRVAQGWSDPATDIQGTGWEALEHMIVNVTTPPAVDGETAGSTASAILAFSGPRAKEAAWLAAPAPLGAVDFVSPDAHIAFAGLVADPAVVLDDLVAIAAREHPEGGNPLAGIEEELGISLRRDLAETLGGEVAFAFDGPVLPQPTWKLVVEVLDADRLQRTLETVVEAVNRQPDREGHRLELSQESSGGRVVYQVVARRADGSPAAAPVHYLYHQGYLLAGPNRAMLLDAIAQRGAGVTLVSSRRFAELLPRDGETDFSAMAYQNLGSGAGSFASWMASAVGASQMPADQRDQLLQLASQVGAGLALAYGGEDRITIAARSTDGLFGLSMERLMSLGGVLRPRQPAAPEGGVRSGAAPGARAAGTRRGVAA